MVKYALVRHPDNTVDLGIYRDVESQREEMQIIPIEEMYESECLEEKVGMVIVFFLTIIAITVAYAS